MLTISIVSCKSDDDGDSNAYLLTNANLAGNYNITMLTFNIDQVFEFNGVPVTSNTTGVGDTFQVDFVFNENGTYTAQGQYRIVTNITVGGNTETDSEIIVLNENGSFQLNANNEKITFDGDFADGTFDVSLFNQNEIRLTQTTSEVTSDGSIDTQAEIRMVRQ